MTPESPQSAPSTGLTAPPERVEAVDPHRQGLEPLFDVVPIALVETEIHETTGIKRGSVGAALSRLEDRGLIRHRGGYWAIDEDDRIASYAAKTQASSASTADDYDDEE